MVKSTPVQQRTYSPKDFREHEKVRVHIVGTWQQEQVREGIVLGVDATKRDLDGPIRQALLMEVNALERRGQRWEIEERLRYTRKLPYGKICGVSRATQ